MFAVLAALTGLAGCYIPVPLASIDGTDFQARVAQAQRPVAVDAGPLTLSAAATRIRDHHPAIQAARLQVQAETQAAEVSEPFPNPTIRLRGMRLDDVSRGTPDLRLALRVPLPHPGVRAAELDAARIEVAATLADLDAEIAFRVAGARRLMGRLALLDHALTRAQEAEALAGKGLARVEAQADAAVQTRLALASARLVFEEAADAYRGIRAERTVTEARLREALHWPAEAPLTLEPGLGATLLAAPDLEEGDEAALIALALESRPVLRGALARAAAAQASKQGAELGKLPWISFVEVAYELETPNPDGAAFEFALAVEFPVGAWFGSEAEAHATVAKAQEARALAQAAEVVAEVRRAIIQVRATAARMDGLASGLVPASEAGAREARAAAARPGVDLAQVARLEAARLGAIARLERARLDHLDALGALEAALGMPLSQALLKR